MMTESTTPLTLLYITAPNKLEAVDIAKALLQDKLIACANISDKVTSVYRWQGTLEETHETVITAKTRSALVKEAIKKVKELHSYDTPCIIALPISDAYAPFAEWVKEETRR